MPEYRARLCFETIKQLIRAANENVEDFRWPRRFRARAQGSGRTRADTRSIPTDEVFLQPWFVPKKTFFTIRKLLPNCHLMKFQYYFADYGCMRCNRKNEIYGSNGLCKHCNRVIRLRLVFSLKRRFKKIGVNLPDGPMGAY